MTRRQNRYSALVEKVFFGGFSPKKKRIPFHREDIERAAEALEIKLPKNLGDVIYSIRYRTSLPKRVLETQPEGYEWIIEGVGRSAYAFKLVRLSRVVPRTDLKAIKIPDATPEIIRSYAQTDEQALLAIVRYNRLIDIFLGIATYSLQSHWRTTIGAGVQIEIDEIYVGIDRHGCHFVIPVQAKGGNDQIGVVQTRQDLICCSEKFPGLATRAISAQFMDDATIAMFELTVDEDEVKVVEERHYRLVPADEIDAKAVRRYRR